MKNKLNTSLRQKAKLYQHFLQDKNGNLSMRELMVLVSMLCFIISWIAEQFFHLPIPEYMFCAFVSLAGAGCFGYSLEKKTNFYTKTNKTENEN
jgi:hypothetical protein